MRLKYFMRGLGSGIVLTTVVLALTMKTPSDAQIIKRATELGMVEKQVEGQSTEELANLKDKSNITTDLKATSKENATSEVKTNADDAKEEKEEAEESEAEEPEPEEEPEKAEAESQKTIVINEGMYSYSVAKLLEYHGIIDNAKEFDHYLVQNDFEHRIQQGTFQFMVDMDYDKIVEKITK